MSVGRDLLDIYYALSNVGSTRQRALAQQFELPEENTAPPSLPTLEFEFPQPVAYGRDDWSDASAGERWRRHLRHIGRLLHRQQRRPRGLTYFFEDRRQSSRAKTPSTLRELSASRSVMVEPRGLPLGMSLDSSRVRRARPLSPATPSRWTKFEIYNPQPVDEQYADFVEACQEGDVDEVRQLWDEKFHHVAPEMRQLPADNASHPLLHAVHRLNVGVVEFLLEKGFSPHLRGTVHPYSGDQLRSEDGEGRRISPRQLADLLRDRLVLESKNSKKNKLLRSVHLVLYQHEATAFGTAEEEPHPSARAARPEPRWVKHARQNQNALAGSSEEPAVSARGRCRKQQRPLPWSQRQVLPGVLREHAVWCHEEWRAWNPVSARQSLPSDRAGTPAEPTTAPPRNKRKDDRTKAQRPVRHRLTPRRKRQRRRRRGRDLRQMPEPPSRHEEEEPRGLFDSESSEDILPATHASGRQRSLRQHGDGDGSLDDASSWSERSLTDSLRNRLWDAEHALDEIAPQASSSASEGGSDGASSCDSVLPLFSIQRPRRTPNSKRNRRRSPRGQVPGRASGARNSPPPSPSPDRSAGSAGESSTEMSPGKKPRPPRRSRLRRAKRLEFLRDSSRAGPTARLEELLRGSTTRSAGVRREKTSARVGRPAEDVVRPLDPEEEAELADFFVAAPDDDGEGGGAEADARAAEADARAAVVRGEAGAGESDVAMVGDAHHHQSSERHWWQCLPVAIKRLGKQWDAAVRSQQEWSKRSATLAPALTQHPEQRGSMSDAGLDTVPCFDESAQCLALPLWNPQRATTATALSVSIPSWPPWAEEMREPGGVHSDSATLQDAWGRASVCIQRLGASEWSGAGQGLLRGRLRCVERQLRIVLQQHVFSEGDTCDTQPSSSVDRGLLKRSRSVARLIDTWCGGVVGCLASIETVRSLLGSFGASWAWLGVSLVCVGVIESGRQSAAVLHQTYHSLEKSFSEEPTPALTAAKAALDNAQSQYQSEVPKVRDRILTLWVQAVSKGAVGPCIVSPAEDRPALHNALWILWTANMFSSNPPSLAPFLCRSMENRFPEAVEAASWHVAAVNIAAEAVKQVPIPKRKFVVLVQCWRSILRFREGRLSDDRSGPGLLLPSLEEAIHQVDESLRESMQEPLLSSWEKAFAATSATEALAEAVQLLQALHPSWWALWPGSHLVEPVRRVYCTVAKALWEGLPGSSPLPGILFAHPEQSMATHLWALGRKIGATLSRRSDVPAGMLGRATRLMQARAWCRGAVMLTEEERTLRDSWASSCEQAGLLSVDATRAVSSSDHNTTTPSMVALGWVLSVTSSLVHDVPVGSSSVRDLVRLIDIEASGPLARQWVAATIAAIGPACPDEGVSASRSVLQRTTCRLGLVSLQRLHQMAATLDQSRRRMRQLAVETARRRLQRPGSAQDVAGRQTWRPAHARGRQQPPAPLMAWTASEARDVASEVWGDPQAEFATLQRAVRQQEALLERTAAAEAECLDQVLQTWQCLSLGTSSIDGNLTAATGAEKHRMMFWQGCEFTEATLDEAGNRVQSRMHWYPARLLHPSGLVHSTASEDRLGVAWPPSRLADAVLRAWRTDIDQLTRPLSHAGCDGSAMENRTAPGEDSDDRRARESSFGDGSWDSSFLEAAADAAAQVEAEVTSEEWKREMRPWWELWSDGNSTGLLQAGEAFLAEQVRTMQREVERAGGHVAKADVIAKWRETWDGGTPGSGDESDVVGRLRLCLGCVSESWALGIAIAGEPAWRALLEQWLVDLTEHQPTLKCLRQGTTIGACEENGLVPGNSSREGDNDAAMEAALAMVSSVMLRRVISSIVHHTRVHGIPDSIVTDGLVRTLELPFVQRGLAASLLGMSFLRGGGDTGPCVQWLLHVRPRRGGGTAFLALQLWELVLERVEAQLETRCETQQVGGAVLEGLDGWRRLAEDALQRHGGDNAAIQARQSALVMLSKMRSICIFIEDGQR